MEKVEKMTDYRLLKIAHKKTSKSLARAILETELMTGKKPDHIFYSIMEFNEKIDEVEPNSVILLYEKGVKRNGTR